MTAVDYRAAAQVFHWFLFAQEADLPERLLAADPDAFIDRALAKMTGGRDVIEPAALNAYRVAFRDPTVRHAICEEYRAAMNEDLALDAADRAAGRRISCPVLVLWPRETAIPSRPTPIETWRSWADDVTGTATGGGHLQPEDAPDEVLASLPTFVPYLPPALTAAISLCCRDRSLIYPALDQQGPDDAGRFVGQGHGDQHLRLARQHPRQPRTRWRAALTGPADHGAGAQNEMALMPSRSSAASRMALT
jgi:hypothetical protein